MRLFKKFLSFGTAIIISSVCSLAAHAQNPPTAVEALLAAIKDDTGRILNKIDNLPDYFQEIGYYLINLTDNDTSNHTANLQQKFSDLGILLNTNIDRQNALTYVYNQQNQSRTGLNVDLLGPDVTTANLWYANDLLYTTLLGRRYFEPDPRGNQANPEYNYIRNASGINLQHLRPSLNWGGTKENQTKYQNYFNMLMAAESFGGYVLANQYVDGNQLNTKQKELVSLASSGTFFTEVGAQPIGRVLRQMLMFESQMYVLMTQMLQYQKQMVTAQVINNALLIANMQTTETVLTSRAQGVAIQ